MLAGARQAIRSQYSPILLTIAVVALLAIAAVGSGASVLNVAPGGHTEALGAARSVGGAVVAMFAAALVIAAALAALILYSLLSSRRRGKAPDDVEWISQPPPTSLLEKIVMLALLVLLIMGFAGGVVLVTRSSGAQSPSAVAVQGSGQAEGGAMVGSGAARRSANTPVDESGGWAQLGLIVGGVLVGGVVFAAFALPRLRKRRSSEGGREEGALRRRDAAAEAVALSLDDLRRERDPRRAIVAAYARMEWVFARAGLPRSPHETPTEFLRRVLSGASAPPAAVSDLTQLFQEAKFSRHELTSDQRDEALRSLLQIRDAMAP